MSITQNIFNIQIKTTNTKIDEQTISSIINDAIKGSMYSSNLTYKLCKTEIVYDFTDNIEMFFAFLKYSKEQFFEKYPYLTHEEYSLTISAFNQDKINVLITFIENTSEKVLAEPYNLESEECNKVATAFAKRFLSPQEWNDFINEAEKRKIKIIY